MDETGAPPEQAQTQRIRQWVSAWMDEWIEACESFASAAASAGDRAWMAQAGAQDPRVRAAWLEYHSIGDCLRGVAWAPDIDQQAFLARLRQRLLQEPAPDGADPRQPAWFPLQALWMRARARGPAWAGGLLAAALLLFGEVLWHEHAARPALAAQRPVPPPSAQAAAWQGAFEELAKGQCLRTRHVAAPHQKTGK